MLNSTKRKILVTISLCAIIVLAQSFTKPEGKKKGTNLKVLPKNIAEDELIGLMKGYAKSLGVKCKFCHLPLASDSTKFDFASDAKVEKITARKMITMVNGINKKYLGKMDEHMEAITCVTCHMGNTQPLVSVDSLKTRQ